MSLQLQNLFCFSVDNNCSLDFVNLATWIKQICTQAPRIDGDPDMMLWAWETPSSPPDFRLQPRPEFVVVRKLQKNCRVPGVGGCWILP
jgi:hypothetical protein